MTRSAVSATTPMSWVISTSAMPLRCLSDSSRSRICAWIVTSSAVVGSSAMSSFGRQASAIAIITLWLMPPESWCGKARARRAGSGMPTSASSSTTRLARARRSRSRWAFSASLIWKPTVKQGFSDDIGSWKIIARSLPAMRRRWAGVIVIRSAPSNAMRSAVTLAVNGSSPITASIATDLPEPDSPTIASTPSRSTVTSRPSTATKSP